MAKPAIAQIPTENLKTAIEELWGNSALIN